METPCTLPWQTPGLKMERKRAPHAGGILKASAAKQQRTPPPSKSSESLIWRTRSLDDGRSARSNSEASHGEERRDESLHLNEKESHDEDELQQPLHSSFDASLLENDDFHSIFRVCKRRASSGTASGLAGSWDVPAAKKDWTPHSSGRKHLRQKGTAQKADDDEEEDELVCPGTVRKLARHNSSVSPKSKGTPVRPPTHWRTTNTRVAAAPNNQSVWKPPLIKFPLTPNAPFTTSSTATTHPPTTQERPLETTLEMDSLATNNSPSTTPFRFTSFPASLPRIHPPLREMNHGSVPDSVRKRMFPPSTHHHAAGVAAAAAPPPPVAPFMNQSREEDGTQNTSISSLSTHGEEDPRMPPVHTRLFMEEEYAYSDDEEDDDDDDCTGVVGRTRLNFNLMLSPKMATQKDESPFKDLSQDVLKMPLEEPEDATAPTDLSRPYEQRHVHSFPSTMSSHTPLRSLSVCDDVATASTSGLTASGGEPTLDAPAAQQSDHHHHHHHHHHQLRMPKTPEEVQLHFQFDATQCSPILGIPEEEELRSRPTIRTGKACSRLPPKPQLTNSTLSSSAAPASSTAETSNLPTCKFSSNQSGCSKEANQDDPRHSFSQESVSSSASAKLRRFRPMPDLQAFSESGQDRSGDNTSGNIRSPPPKLLCPPTPVRTPVWAHATHGSDDGSGTGVERPLLHHHHRSNSLIVTRVLATCSPEALDPNYSANNACAAPTKSTGGAAMEVEMDFETGALKLASSHYTKKQNSPQHPEAPPPIRRSVHELGSIISFETEFEVLGILGKGAFADVYKVRSKIDSRLYAVKRRRQHFRGKRDRDVALAEVRSMQRLQQQHYPHSAPKVNDSLQYLLFFYRAWQEEGHFFCQTELCCRDTCRELLNSLSHEWCVAQKRYPSLLRNTLAPEGVVAGSPLDVNGRLLPNDVLWKVCHDICAGLSHMHSRGLVHRDVKPDNMLLGVHGDSVVCKIGDFGMTATIGDSEDGQEGDTIYMAPELLSSAVKHSSADIFSLGLTMYEMAALVDGFELPKQGPRWHELRNGYHIPQLPSSRDPLLGYLIQHMISASQDKRPSATAILEHEKVHAAGLSNDGEKFLHDYVQDIEDYDRRELERQAAASNQMADDRTPRTSAGVPCRARVCSPTLGHLTSTAPNMFTPEAQ